MSDCKALAVVTSDACVTFISDGERVNIVFELEGNSASADLSINDLVCIRDFINSVIPEDNSKESGKLSDVLGDAILDNIN